MKIYKILRKQEYYSTIRRPEKAFEPKAGTDCGFCRIRYNKSKKENEIIDGVEDNNINNEQNGQDTDTNTE